MAGGDVKRAVVAGVALTILGSGGTQAATTAQAHHPHRKPVKHRVAARPIPRLHGPAGKAIVRDPTGTGGRITPRMARVHALMAERGYDSRASCWDRHEWNPSSDHPRGKACDYMINPRSKRDVRRGWDTARWLAANAHELGIKYVIWQGRSWSTANPRWKPYHSGVYHCPDPGNVTGCHYDHIHVSVR